MLFTTDRQTLDLTAINDRSGIIQYFSADPGFPFDRELFDVAEQYLRPGLITLRHQQTFGPVYVLNLLHDNYRCPPCQFIDFII